MKIAVPYENGRVCSNLEEAMDFMFYDIEDEQLVDSSLMSAAMRLDADGLAGFLAGMGADMVFCSNAREDTAYALADEQVELLCGVKGRADSAVALYLNGCLICHKPDYPSNKSETE